MADAKAAALDAFFADPRAGAGAAGLASAEAGRMLADFTRHHRLQACSAEQLLALAEICLRARRLDTAREAFLLAAQTPTHAHLACYKLGRMAISATDPAAAAAFFAQGTHARAGFAHNWIGLARTLAALGRLDPAADAADRFIAFGLRPHAPEDLDSLIDLADRLAERGDTARAGPLRVFALSHGASEARDTLRQAETLLAAGDAKAALALLTPLLAARALDPRGLRLIAHCEHHAGNPLPAADHAQAAFDAAPNDTVIAASYLDLLVRTRDPQRWRDALLRNRDRLPPDARLELGLRVLLADGTWAEIISALADIAIQPKTRLFYVLMDAAYAALNAADYASAATLADRLMQIAPDIPAPFTLRIDICLRQHDWAGVGKILAATPPRIAELPQILLKWFEYHSFCGHVEEARAARAKLEAAGLPTRQATLPILRFLAERQEWDELASLALAWIGTDFRYAQIGYLLFRAARHTRREADFLDAIARIDNWRDHPDLARLHTAIAWDGATTLPERQKIRAQAPASLHPAMRHRMDVQLRLAQPPSPPRRALFLCTNATYLCATIVALHSALSHSAPGREDCYIIVDDDLAARTENWVQPFRNLGFSVTIVPAGDVVADMKNLNPAYGLFTSGHILAQAAYYRIYFAAHLQKTGRYDRAIYIDGDVLVRKPLDELFALDISPHPLAARIEPSRPEVTRAIALHKLRGNLYFNSGILLFDLTHKHLAKSLKASIAAIADDRVTLLYHDQCALNLGFRNHFLPLGIEWNTPVTETTEPADAAILHFLERPKPWSSAYDGTGALLWFDQWEKTARLIGEEAEKIFGLANS